MNGPIQKPGRVPGKRWWAAAIAATLFTGIAVATRAVAATPDPVDLCTTTATTWKYLQDDVDPSAGDSDDKSWTKSAFDDSSWLSASGAFGAKRGAATGLGDSYPINTLLKQYVDEAQTTDVRTYFFRSSFELSANQLQELSNLSGTVVYDDALQIFVNGTKVAGYVDDAVTENLQYAGNSNGDPLTSTFTVSPTLLNQGSNTVAVALYQDRATSSDIYLNFANLTANFTDPTAVPELSDLSLNVGSDATERNLSWYSSLDVNQSVQIAPASAMTGSEFPSAQATSFSATGGSALQLGTYWRHATITGLQPGSEYLYRVGDETAWSETRSFKTQAADSKFEFLVVGDVQVGSSGNLANDQSGWENTMTKAVSTAPNLDFVLSLGDQVNTASNEDQYNSFLAPSQLAGLPVATNIGNHDVGSQTYSQHFNMPNVDSTHGGGSGSSAGGDYWFIYDNALFLNLNSNNTDNASHAEFIEQVIAAHPQVKWRIVSFHHSIYSTAAHANDTDIIARRDVLPTVLSNSDIDLVMMGHDHVYARTWLIKDGTVTEDISGGAKAKVAAKPGEVLYITGNSASGSKYYSISGAYDWSAVTNQDQQPSYTQVQVTDTAITLNTVRTADGSKVDEVELSEADQTKPQITLPSNNQVSVGEAFDPMAGVSATDDVDGDLTSAITISGSVNNAAVGSYSLTYSVSDAAGNTATVTRTVTVVKATFAVSPAPQIVGRAKVGYSLAASISSWKPAGTFTYQWLLNGRAIAGQTRSSLYLSERFADGKIAVKVTGSRTGYVSLTRTSTEVKVQKGTFSKVSRPQVRGKAKVGRTLSVSTGKWSPVAKFGFQWLANGQIIKGAQKSTLKLSKKLAGKRISVRMTSSRTGFTSIVLTSIRTAKTKR